MVLAASPQGFEVEVPGGDLLYFRRGNDNVSVEQVADPEPLWQLGHVVQAECDCVLARAAGDVWRTVAHNGRCEEVGHGWQAWLDDRECPRPLTILGAPTVDPSQQPEFVEPAWRRNHVVETRCGCLWLRKVDFWACIEPSYSTRCAAQHGLTDEVDEGALPRPLIVRSTPVEAGGDDA
jgi:hypothetical protein